MVRVDSRYALLRQRSLAYVMDIVVIYFVANMVGFDSSDEVGVVVVMSCSFVYFVAAEAWSGQTLGKYVCRVRVVMSSARTNPTVRAAIIRRSWLPFAWLVAGLWPTVLGAVGSSLVLLFLFATIALEPPCRQGWHDRLASTRVVWS